MKSFNSILSICLFILAIFFNNSCSTSPQYPVNENALINDTAKVYTVEIKQMKFVPDEIKVQRGDKIVFVNRDVVTHDVTEWTKKAWTSAPLATGQYWTLTASESVDYYCSIHQVMKGKILVE